MARAFITVASMPMWSPVTRSSPAALQRRTAEQIATTDHQTDLDTDTHQLPDFQRHAIQNFRVDPDLFSPSGPHR